MASYRVYVIGLKPEVLQVKKFRDKNPDYVEGKACYYVGYTGTSPEVRAEIHRTGGLSKKGNKIFSRIANKYYDGLRKRQYEKIRPFSNANDAMEAEKALAEKLRKKGFAVWQN